MLEHGWKVRWARRDTRMSMGDSHRQCWPIRWPSPTLQHVREGSRPRPSLHVGGHELAASVRRSRRRCWRAALCADTRRRSCRRASCAASSACGSGRSEHRGRSALGGRGANSSHASFASPEMEALALGRRPKQLFRGRRRCETTRSPRTKLTPTLDQARALFPRNATALASQTPQKPPTACATSSTLIY